MKRALFIFFLLISSLVSYAQIPAGFDLVTATVPQLGGAQFSAAFTSLSLSSQLPLLGGVSVFQQTISGSFDFNGRFSVLVADNTQIIPLPSTWTWSITYTCPNQPSGGVQVQIAINAGGGTTQDISSPISAALPANPCQGARGQFLPLTGGTLTGAVSGPTFHVSGSIDNGSGGPPTVATGAPVGNQVITPNTINAGTFPISVTSENLVQKVETFAGATADVKINACLAAISSGGGVCDARGFGATTQTIASTVTIGGGNNYQKLLFSPATSFTPAGPSTPSVMFSVGRNGDCCEWLRVALPSTTSVNFTSNDYTGTVVSVTDTVSSPLAFRLHDFLVDSRASYDNNNFAGTCLNVTNPASGYFELVNIHDIVCHGLKTGLSLNSVIASTFTNGINFSNIMLNGQFYPIILNASASGQIIGNNFSNVVIEAAWQLNVSSWSASAGTVTLNITGVAPQYPNVQIVSGTPIMLNGLTGSGTCDTINKVWTVSASTTSSISFASTCTGSGSGGTLYSGPAIYIPTSNGSVDGNIFSPIAFWDNPFLMANLGGGSVHDNQFKGFSQFPVSVYQDPSIAKSFTVFADRWELTGTSQGYQGVWANTPNWSGSTPTSGTGSFTGSLPYGTLAYNQLGVSEVDFQNNTCFSAGNGGFLFQSNTSNAGSSSFSGFQAQINCEGDIIVAGSATVGGESGQSGFLACYTTGGKMGHCTTAPSGTPPTCGCTNP